MRAVAELQLRQILGERKLMIAIFIGLSPARLAVAVAVSGGLPIQQEARSMLALFLFIVYPQSVSIVLALLYGTALFNAEIQARTAIYLFTRPVSKLRLVLSKYVVIVGLQLAITLPSLVVAWLVLRVPDSGDVLLGAALTVVVATFAYSAIFALIGVLFTRRSMVIGLGYAVIVEFLLSLVPALVNTLTLNYHLRSILSRIAELQLPAEAWRVLGEAPLGEAIGYPVIATLVALALTAFISGRREFSTHDEP